MRSHPSILNLPKTTFIFYNIRRPTAKAGAHILLTTLIDDRIR